MQGMWHNSPLVLYIIYSFFRKGHLTFYVFFIYLFDLVFMCNYLFSVKLITAMGAFIAKMVIDTIIISIIIIISIFAIAMQPTLLIIAMGNIVTYIAIFKLDSSGLIFLLVTLFIIMLIINCQWPAIIVSSAKWATIVKLDIIVLLVNFVKFTIVTLLGYLLMLHSLILLSMIFFVPLWIQNEPIKKIQMNVKSH